MSQTYLVVVRHTMDDIPFKLFSGDGALVRATEFCQELKRKYHDESAENWFCLTPKWWNTDASTPQSVAIVVFDEDGMASEIAEQFELDSE